MTNDQIRDIFMQHSFTIKEGQTDLKPYVYAAARHLLSVALPPLNDDLRSILGRICFQCIHLANALRAIGYEIPNKAEDEQAAVIHFLLDNYFKHGEQWAEKASDILKAAAQEQKT